MLLNSVKMSNVTSLLLMAALSLLVVMSFAALVFSFSDFVALTGWVSFVFMCATPMQIILALLWKTEYPTVLKGISQPIKGLILTAAALVSGLVLAYVLYKVVGGGKGGITPMLAMYTILTVLVALWFIPVWHCWPVTYFSKNLGVIGGVTLVLIYLIAYALFNLLFDFSFLSAAPFYTEALDPSGLFNAWIVLSFLVTTVSVIMLLMLMDFWPIVRLIPSLGQPLTSLVTSMIVFLVSAVIYTFFVSVLEYDSVVFMVRYPVCIIFGTFIVNNLMQHRLFSEVAQPARGLLLIILAIVFAQIVYPLYTWMASAFTDISISSGGPNYQLEVWIASAMLGVTFPLIIIVSEFFKFWPFISVKKVLMENTVGPKSSA